LLACLIAAFGHLAARVVVMVRGFRVLEIGLLGIVARLIHGVLRSVVQREKDSKSRA